MSAARDITPELLRELPLPRLGGDSDKDARGRVLVIGGGAEVPGAVLLAGIAALRAGAGKLQMAATPRFADHLAMAAPEARVLPAPADANGDLVVAAAEALAGSADRCDAVVVGPGMLDDEVAGALAAELIQRAPNPAFLLDAAAMTGLRDRADALKAAAGRLVLTPHGGEMAALMGCDKAEVQADPLGLARRAAQQLGAVVALKGETTRIVSPDGHAVVYHDGPVGLATSGSGDVLAGVIGGLLARGAPPFAAAAWGVYLHGQAGVRLSQSVGPLGFLAREIAAEIPPILAELCP